MIDVTHLGEALISGLINDSKAVGQMIIPPHFNPSSSLFAVPELRLNTCGNLVFDGTHQVDIAILDTENKLCYPIEAKLGHTRLNKSEFEKRFLKRCNFSHQGTRVKGSMISILERQLPTTCLDKNLSVTFEGDTYQLTHSWGTS